HGGFNFDDPAGEFRNNAFFDVYEDRGRILITGDTFPFDEGKFKVPSLRNIEYTAPYMHNGSFNSLEEVIDRYVEVGAPTYNRHPNADGLIGNIRITEADKEDLIAFLKALSDPAFINNPAFKP
ncbi:MAG: cytochrome-c peroxidase, partial [Bacteroidota bacterium]